MRRDACGRVSRDEMSEGQRTIQISKLLPDQETLPLRIRTSGSAITRAGPGKGDWKRTPRWAKKLPKYGSFSREDQISFLTTTPGMNELFRKVRVPILGIDHDQGVPFPASPQDLLHGARSEEVVIGHEPDVAPTGQVRRARVIPVDALVGFPAVI